jgi:murein L,D-transpeptidase YafK
MTEEKLARREHDPWLPFWRTLKRGYDAFEATGLPPRIAVCGGAYTIAAPPPAGNGSDEIGKDCLSLTGSEG